MLAIFGATCKATTISLDVPGATSTSASGINNRGDIVGSYSDDFGSHGFIYSDGQFTTISSLSAATGINDYGMIIGTGAGQYNNQAGLYNNGIFTPINVPGATFTSLSGINNNGTVVGTYGLVTQFSFDPQPVDRTRGFLYNAGDFTTYNFQDFPPYSTHLTGIYNSGELIGYAALPDVVMPFGAGQNLCSVLFCAGLPSLTPIPTGINDHDDIVGLWPSYFGYYGPFLIRGGTTPEFLDVPGGVSGINDSGTIVGTWTDSANHTHGYYTSVALADVPEPRSLGLVGLGLGAAILRLKVFRPAIGRRRRAVVP